MDKKNVKKLLGIFAACYWALVLMIYIVAGEQFHYTQITSSALSPTAVIGELIDGMVIKQRMTIEADRLESVNLMVDTYSRVNDGVMHVRILDQNDVVLSDTQVQLSNLASGTYNTIMLEEPIDHMRGNALTLQLTTEGCMPGNAITLYYGNSVTAGRFDIVKQIQDDEFFQINEYKGAGMLCVTAGGKEYLNFYKTYWLITPAIFALLALLAWRSWRGLQKGKENGLALMHDICFRYGFLMEQLVGRDFKAKYKRSVLGVAWSFLNPLMTMAVQYIVFSTMFKSGVANYPVYLLTGTVFFNFFNEAVGTGMTSIVGNAHLIKKVYMPRYIYPIAKICSSMVNFGFALIPLVLVLIFTGTPLRPSLLLLVFDVLCMIGFVTGMVLILSVCMTFFQDTQFLWGVVSMMWMYLTPIFYPETIIPQNLLTLYHMNPMYQYITFARVAIIGGVSPAPSAYLWCLLSSVFVLFVGIKVFNKYQDELVLHL